ncbi:MAG: glycosyltransferase family 4 protein [Fimbriimonas sp.]|nr:glycosyltransferase family 4 protein [Fimbriimonas sp.]
MKVIILTQNFLPEPRRMFLEMAQELQSRGHQVQVVTGYPNWPSGTIYPGYKVKLFQREVIEGIDVLRLPIYPDHSRSKIRRILNLSTLAVSFLFLGPWLLRRPNLIHIIQLPTLCVSAYILGLFWRTKFTLDVLDMWPETLTATGMMNNKSILNTLNSLCNWTYKKAARIRVGSPGCKRNLIEKGVPSEKIDVIFDWIDTDYYRPVAPNPVKAKELGLDGKFNVVYAGTIGLAQGLETVLYAADLLRDLPEVQIVFAGGGVDEENIRAKAVEMTLPNVKFLGLLQSNEMPDLYALSDVLIAHLKKDPLFFITVPSKVVSHFAVGKPTLNAVEGDTADLVAESQAGISVPPEDPKAMADAIRQFYAMPKEELLLMGQRGREAAVDRYSRTVLCAEFEKMLVRATHKS